MNVRAGDRARIVTPGQINDGAIVLVVASDEPTSKFTGQQWWLIEGQDLALFVDNRPWPDGIGSEATCPDRMLRRVPPDEQFIDAVRELEVVA